MGGWPRTLVVALALVAGCRLDFDPVAAAPDAGAPDPDALDACAARLFCDGFEDPGLAAWAGTVVPGGSTVARVDAPAVRGGALRASGADGVREAAIYADPFPPATAEHWLRAFIYVPTGAPLSVEPLVLGTPSGSAAIVLAIYDGGHDIHAHGIAGDFVSEGVGELPRDTWICVELHVTAGVSGVVEVYRDGALDIASPTIDTTPPAGESLARVTVGIASKPAAGAQTIFIDEVIADDTRIGCALP